MIKLIQVFCFLFLLLSCKSDDEKPSAGPSTLDVVFLLEYDGEPVTAIQSYDYFGQDICFDKFKFFYSDLKIGDQVLSDIGFVEMSDDLMNDSTSIAGTTLSFTDIPSGEYTGIQFGLGVSSDLNSTTPADYTAVDPLGNATEHWQAWGSYIFSKIEGKIDADGNGLCEKGFTYHNGADDVYKMVDLSKSITLSPNTSARIEVKVNLKSALYPNNNPIDIANVQGAHNPGDLTFMIALSQSLSESFGIKQ